MRDTGKMAKWNIDRVEMLKKLLRSLVPERYRPIGYLDTSSQDSDPHVRRERTIQGNSLWRTVIL